MKIDSHKIRWFIYSFVNGIYSGIPVCCVINYCKDASEEGTAVAMAKKCGMTWKEYAAKVPTQYVPCQKCFNKRKFAKIRFNGTIFGFIVNRKDVVIYEKRIKSRF